MHYRRRSLLKAGGASISSAALLGKSTPETRAAPAVRWEPAAKSNYWDGNRTTADIDWIILHTIEGPYQAGINTFKKPSEDVSAHYVVGPEPGQFTKMVRNRDIAWTAGNAGYNERGINIEMGGSSSTGFSDQMYENMAELVEFLCEGYDVPKRGPEFRVAPCDPAAGSGGIIGHVHIPDPENCSSRGGAGGHTDPGPYFDYDRLLEAITGDPKPAFEIGQTVTATRDLNVRAEPEIGFNVVHTFPAGTTGTVRDGYTIAENYLWWEIDWEDDVTGWAIQSYMKPGEDRPPGRGDDDSSRGDRDNRTPDDGGGTDGSENEQRTDEPGDDESDDQEETQVGDTQFQIGETVTTTVELNTRNTPTVSGALRETLPAGTGGRIQDGIVTADGFTWWQIEWKTGTTGWSVQRYLEQNTESIVPENTTFDIGEEVTSSVELNTRAEPSLGGLVRETVSTGTTGWIQDGIVTADGYTWWQVEWETGTTGWSVEAHLDRTGTGDRDPSDEEPRPDPGDDEQDNQNSSDDDTDATENARFDVGEVVAATVDLNTRTKPSLDGTIRTTVDAGTAGWIQDGIVTADGYTWWQIEWETGTTGWSAQTHLERGGGVDGLDSTATRFDVGQRVTAIVELNTRETPSIDGALRDTLSPETVGWIQDGIVRADGYTWWQVEWETGTTGWSVEAYLDESNSWEWVSGLFGE